MSVFGVQWPASIRSGGRTRLDPHRTADIARHAVAPDEFEEVCFALSPVQRVKADGENPVYYVPGQIRAGRYLFCVVIAFPDGNGFPITARPMTDNGKHRYRQWKNR